MIKPPSTLSSGKGAHKHPEIRVEFIYSTSYVISAATDEELSQKYHEVANGIIPAERAHEIEQALWHVAEMADVSELVDMLTLGLG